MAGAVKKSRQTSRVETKAQQEDFVERLAQIQDGQYVEYPVTAEDIGGELLAVLSKGLYTNPLAAIREYVQNAVDARATEVTVHITGNSVFILDDGLGMSASELLDARKFGVSKKSIAEQVGFRGIGIYSGFDLCNRLRVTTKQSRTDKSQILEFDFGKMKAILYDARKAPSRPSVPLSQLLSDYTHFSVRGGYPEDRSFTQVVLEDINDVHIRRLSNRGELRAYVLRNLPIDFDPDFKYRDLINAQLQQYVKGYNPIRMTLRSDGIEDEVIVKPNIPNLGPPTMELVCNSLGKVIAFYWACLTEQSQRISAQDPSLSEFEGLVYKVKGFTIGNQEKIRSLWGGKKALYSWCTGEVYVLDEDVIPNAERDDFETNNAKRALEAALEGVIYSNDRSLYNIAKEKQQQRRATHQIGELRTKLCDIELAITRQTYDILDAFSRLEEIGRKLKYYRRLAPKEQAGEADGLIERVEWLRTALQAEVDQGISVSEQKKLKTAKAPISEPQPAAGEAGSHTDESKEETEEPEQEETAEPVEFTLLGLFEDVGWELDGNCRGALQIVQEALAGVLGETSRQYRDVLEEIETRLTEELEE
jgi:molecular chaperone HtpG